MDAPRTWLAGPHEADDVARLLIAFRDWYGRDDPPDAAFHAGVRRLIERDDTDYLLASAPGSARRLCARRSSGRASAAAAGSSWT